MRNEQSGVPEIDLLAIRDALKLRWWIVPVMMLVSVGFLFANESNLATEPGYVVVSRAYEARDEAAVLTVAGIDPGSIIPYPSFDNQLIILKSNETKQKISDAIGSDTGVSVSRTEQKFSLVDTVEGEGKTRFTFLSVGVPTYGFSCITPLAETCNTAIDAYVTELSRLRQASVQEGFTRAELLLSKLTSGGQGGSQIATQQQALAYAKTMVTGEITLISTATEEIGPTITTVKRPTYIFGMGVGALIGLLIILQLTITDRKIRTVRKLKSAIGEARVLGVLNKDQQGSHIQHTAAAIAFAAAANNATVVRLIPIDETVLIGPIATALSQALHGHSVSLMTTPAIDHLGATDLLAPQSSLVVLVVQARTSRTDVLERAIMVAEHAGNNVAGVILGH
jgi:hypothetical protein